MIIAYQYCILHTARIGSTSLQFAKWMYEGSTVPGTFLLVIGIQYTVSSDANRHTVILHVTCIIQVPTLECKKYYTSMIVQVLGTLCRRDVVGIRFYS